MIFSAVLSKPTASGKEIFKREYERVKITLLSDSADGKEKKYYAEFFTKTQAFQKKFSQEELNDFLEKNIGKTFKNCVERTEKEEITFLTNKKGKTTRLVKKIPSGHPAFFNAVQKDADKKYIIPQGRPVPFLVELGVMTKEGKIVSAKYDKFRQINRFLEFLDDVLAQAESRGKKPLRIIDFGSGKSYLTFAVHYYLTEIKKMPCSILGLDLKKDVIENCTALCKKLNAPGLEFKCGDIAEYKGEAPDIVISLHACDTATDYALDFAIKSGAKIILSVPCCQHEINMQLQKKDRAKTEPLLLPLLKYGIVKERFCALLTDCIRAEILEAAGYSTQLLEFIDMEGTPKNLLIRAVKKSRSAPAGSIKKQSSLSYNTLLKALGASQTLDGLFNTENKK